MEADPTGPFVAACGSDRSPSSKGQCADPTDTWDLAAGQIPIEITKIRFEFLDGFALGQVIWELFEVAKPHPLVLPMDVTSGVHAN